MADSILFAALFAFGLLINFIAARRRIFALPRIPFLLTWRGIDILLYFSAYLVSTLLLGPLLVRFLPVRPGFLMPSMQWISLLCTLLLMLGIKAFSPAHWRWRQNETTPVRQEIKYALLLWCLSLPLVLALDEGLELFNQYVLGVQGEEQMAVRYLKASLSSPFFFATALFAIIIAAPFLEEFLFRGCLQSYLKVKLGRQAGILLSAFCFALFHFSPAQGFGNLPILVSLFAFSIYLGIAYEKTGSLWAPISLHLTFNALSVAYILFTLK